MKLRKIRKIITIAGVALALGAPVVQAQSSSRGSDKENRGQLSEKDYKFISDAAEGGLMEVQLGQMAAQKGNSESVKNFGQRMVTDHGKANDELKQLAVQKGVTLPTAVSHHDQSTVEHLQNSTGKDFDKAYADHMAKDHKSDVKEFEKAAKDCKDPDLKAWASKTLPILQQHLTMAQDMDRAVRNEK
jgi:putative membrane protein